MLDIVDPGGLVRSQAIEGADGKLRITLNEAESDRTFAGQYLARSFGSAVQHVAFETSDIFATADALAANGFDALPVPENYYDDLEARFGIGSERLASLRARSIFYDADDTGGEFLQLYSRIYGAGFFFEIVQRTAGYSGYGAPNAPFRVAAQRRLTGKLTDALL